VCNQSLSERACVLWRRWISSKGKGNRLDVVPLSNDLELASLDWLSGDGADRSACGAAKCHLGGFFVLGGERGFSRRICILRSDYLVCWH